MQVTIDKLREMKMKSMADALVNQQNDPAFKKLSFEEKMSIIVDIEYCSRKNKKLERLIKKAKLDQPQASVANIDYESGRRLDRRTINKLSTCEFISNTRNIIITGATGSGKSYMACAFGMEACKQYYTTKYVRLPDLLIDLDMARQDGLIEKVRNQYAKPSLLIIDEWLLMKPSLDQQYDLLEIIERRYNSNSTIFCSQFKKEGWYSQLGGSESPLAEAILDRIVHNSYVIDIESMNPAEDISMRARYGLNPEEQR